MISRRPIIYLAFANDGKEPLPQLDEERRRIKDVLETRLKGSVELKHEGNADLQFLKEEVKKYGQSMIIFHYGGHADDGTLRLGDERGHAEGLAKALGKLPNLKLVFLNGCSTEDFLEVLFREGVPAVIATSTTIGDDSATELAVRFYEALSENEQGSRLRRRRNTLEAALQEAADDQAWHGPESTPKVEEYTRGVTGPKGAPVGPTPIDAWKLYWAKNESRRRFPPWERRRSIDWRIPQWFPVGGAVLGLGLAASLWVLVAFLRPMIGPIPFLLWSVGPALAFVLVVWALPLLASQKVVATVWPLVLLAGLLASSVGLFGGWTVVRVVFAPNAIGTLRSGASLDVAGEPVPTEKSEVLYTALIGGDASLYHAAFSRTDFTNVFDLALQNSPLLDPSDFSPEQRNGILGTPERIVNLGRIRSVPGLRVQVGGSTYRCQGMDSIDPDVSGVEARAVTGWPPWPRIRVDHCFLWEAA